MLVKIHTNLYNVFSKFCRKLAYDFLVCSLWNPVFLFLKHLFFTCNLAATLLSTVSPKGPSLQDWEVYFWSWRRELLLKDQVIAYHLDRHCSVVWSPRYSRFTVLLTVESGGNVGVENQPCFLLLTSRWLLQAVGLSHLYFESDGKAPSCCLQLCQFGRFSLFWVLTFQTCC